MPTSTYSLFFNPFFVAVIAQNCGKIMPKPELGFYGKLNKQIALRRKKNVQKNSVVAPHTAKNIPANFFAFCSRANFPGAPKRWALSR